MRRVLALWLVCLATAGCMAPSPRYVAANPYGDVFADTSYEAEAVAADLARLMPEIRDLLPGTRASQPEVWIQDELLLFAGSPVHESVGGFAVTRGSWLHWWIGDRIHVVSTVADRRRLYLAHELVHCVIDDVWGTLPPAVEEGLCDEVAIQLAPSRGPTHRGVLMLAAGLATGHLPLSIEYDRPGRRPRRLLLDPTPGAIDPAEALTGDPETVKGTSGLDGMKRRGVGFVVASRIVESGGFEALRAMAEAADARGDERVDPETLLDQAGLEDGGDWRRAIDARIGRGELASIATEIGEELGRRTAAMASYDLSGWSAERFLDDAGVTLVYGRGFRAVKTRVANDEMFRSGLIDAWPDSETRP